MQVLPVESITLYVLFSLFVQILFAWRMKCCMIGNPLTPRTLAPLFFYGPFSWNTVDPFSLAVKQTYLQCFQNALAHNCIRLSITSTRALLVLFCDLAPINLIKTSWLIAGWKSGILLVTKEMHAPGNLLRHFIRSYIYYVLFIICRSLCFLCMIMKAVPNKPISRKQCVWKVHVLTAWFFWKVI